MSAPNIVSIAPAIEEVLRKHFVSPSAVLWPACRKLDVDPAFITPHDLARIIPVLVETVTRVTDRENASQLAAALQALIR